MKDTQTHTDTHFHCEVTALLQIIIPIIDSLIHSLFKFGVLILRLTILDGSITKNKLEIIYDNWTEIKYVLDCCVNKQNMLFENVASKKNWQINQWWK